MSNNTSPLLAATTTTTEEISHVILNTSPHGSDSAPTSPTSLQTSNIFRGTLPARPINDLQNDVSDVRVLPFYQRLSFSNVLTSLAIHFLFPFLNGVMLGFGEICANELAFRMGWFGSRNIPLHSRNEVPLGLKDQYGAGLFAKSKKKRDDNEKMGSKKLEYTDVAPIP